MEPSFAIVPKDTTEDGMIELWIRGKESPHTKRAYRRHIERFRRFIQKPIKYVTLLDMRDFIDSLDGLSENSKKVIVDSIKAYLSFAYKSGVLPANVGAAIDSLKGSETMSERILTEYEVQSMILREKNPRNQALLRVLYDGGLRVSELCNLKWKDVVERGEQIQVGILGKGKKKRFVLLSPGSSQAILAIARVSDSGYVFQSRQRVNSRGENKSERITSSQVLNIVRNAAKRAEVKNWQDVSPQWLRHSHATHAINHGAPLSLVRDTLGHSNIAITNNYIHVRPGDSSSRFLPTI